MMGIIMPETCWAVSVRQSNKILWLLLHLVGCFIWDIHLFLNIITGRCMEVYCNRSPSNHTIHITTTETFSHSLADIYC
jgi:hypothetical protein